MQNYSQTLESLLISNRRLLWALVKRDLRARYAGSGLGVFWSVIHPLIMLVLYIIVFSTLVRGATLQVRGIVAGYAVFLIPALIAWNWFYESLIGATGSITGNANLIKKVVFPSAILPAINIVAGIIPFIVTMLIFLVFAWFMAGFSMISIVYLPLLVILEMALIIGPAYLFASLNVMLRDTSQFLIAALQFLFWGTPIVYTPEALTVPFPWLACWFDINPFAHLVGAFREVIIAHRPPMLGSVLYIAIVSVIMYHAGRTLFMRSRSHFPDEV